MAARDGSFSFDFSGTYETVEDLKQIDYILDDGRKVKVAFKELSAEQTQIDIDFEPESENEHSFQQAGWQAILDNFKKHIEQK